MDKASERRLEAARVEVKRRQLIAEVDVQHDAAGSLGSLGRERDELGADHVETPIRMNAWIEQERVNAPIPSDICKTDQPLAVIRTQIDQAVIEHRLPIARFRRVPAGDLSPENSSKNG